ncbi:MAG TPA: methyltransferase domain-containing protein [Bryobacteraceae bacterium]|jgi:ubiquinone/menaquinone biosynthesis C-methylase UbiE|nr:methyltransferase domain-containing protein [Bryobacteraceae bacterium]
MDWRGQFAKPTGFTGRMVGHLMAMKNGQRSVWVFSLLDLKPTDRVLEIGFGSGADIARAVSSAAFVAGVDHSDVMVRQATRRNARAIREGRVKLELGSCSELAYPASHFDKVFAINSAQFWKDGAKAFAEISRVLKPGGWLALAVQPRSKDATDETARQAGIGLSKALTATGFEEVHCEFQQMRPVATVCVLGRRA